MLFFSFLFCAVELGETLGDRLASPLILELRWCSSVSSGSYSRLKCILRHSRFFLRRNRRNRDKRDAAMFSQVTYLIIRIDSALLVQGYLFRDVALVKVCV